MPRCLMAKKWKVYPWSTTNPSAAGPTSTTVLGVPESSAAAIALNGAHHHLHEKLVVSVVDDDPEHHRSMKKPLSASIICHENEDDDDDEEIDVVTIQQNSTDTKPIIQYQQQQLQLQQQSRQDDTTTTTTTTTTTRTTSPTPPPTTMVVCSSNSQTVIEHTPLPPQNYYQTSAEDYPPLGENQHVVLDGKLLVPSNSQSGQLLPSVIQQHTSHPTPQIRLTSVIQHGASFIQTTSGSSSMQQSPPGQAGMHHSASPMQPQSAWGPSSPTEGATAPSPPPHIQHSSDSDVTTIHYNGYSTASDINHYSAFLPSDGSTGTSRSYATLQSPNESRAAAAAAVAAAAAAALAASNTASAPPTSPVSPGGSTSPTSSIGSSSSSSSSSSGGGSPRTRSLAMCFTSTGAALSLPPKKKDIYRPYSLDDRPSVRWRPPEDLTAAHAILDLSASPPAPAPSQSLQNVSTSQQPPHSGASAAVKTVIPTKPAPTKTIAYTYEAFFVSDGRSKKKSLPVENTSLPGGAVAVVAGAIAAQAVGTDQRPKYTCSECGKQYATSSNLSRHKQTHRSLDSQSAKKCVTCGKAYVSMPALAMHLLTHKLNHACGICGKLFSRPWLLQGHLRSHTGEKPYGCAHCGKAFADRSNLRAHMQTHSTDKNFECTRCHKTFALKSYLNKHLESACVGDTNECSNTAISTIQVPTITHLR